MLNHYLMIKEYWGLLSPTDRGEISKDLAKFSGFTVRYIQMKFAGERKFVIKEMN